LAVLEHCFEHYNKAAVRANCDRQLFFFPKAAKPALS